MGGRRTRLIALSSRRRCREIRPSSAKSIPASTLSPSKPLYQHINELGTDNAHHEYYLTDIVTELLREAGQKVLALRADDSNEVLGVNTRMELADLDAQLRAKKARELMLAGTTFFRPDTCDIDADVEIGTDSVIEPFCTDHRQDEDWSRLPYSLIFCHHQLPDWR